MGFKATFPKPAGTAIFKVSHPSDGLNIVFTHQVTPFLAVMLSQHGIEHLADKFLFGTWQQADLRQYN
jgi:hypothetical protein